MTNTSVPTPIPQPPGYPLVGNLYDIDSDAPIPSFVALLQRYGEIVALDIVRKHVILAGSQKLVHELCDQSRFEKIVTGALAEVRNVAGDGKLQQRLETF
jgi:cytochrome P450/NADPH-cytochrome P450 reductase